MKKFVFIWFIISQFSISFSQELIINQSIRRRIYEIDSKRIDCFSNLPDTIQKTIINFFMTEIGSLSQNFKFQNCQIYDTAQHLNENQELKIKYGNPIPTYDLYYTYKDSSKGIQQFLINLGLDQNGQVLFINFPRAIPKRNLEIIDIKIAKKYADSILKIRGFKKELEKVDYYLVYDPEKDILIWKFHYLIERINSEHGRYKCLLINGHELKLIDLKEIVKGGVYAK